MNRVWVDKYADTREKLIDFFINGKCLQDPDYDRSGVCWDAGYSDGDMERNTAEIYSGNHMVITRFSRDRDEGTFVIYILTQEDLYAGNNGEEADWSDVEWIHYVSGKLADIEDIMTEEVYQGLFARMEEVLDDFMNHYKVVRKHEYMLE